MIIREKTLGLSLKTKPRHSNNKLKKNINDLLSLLEETYI